MDDFLTGFQKEFGLPPPQQLEITPAVPPYDKIPPDLGLTLIRGPVSYMFMTPSAVAAKKEALPTLVLLGDIHLKEYCELTCAKTCVSAQSIQENTFLEYLDTHYARLKPELYLEIWAHRNERLGLTPKTKREGKPSPLDETIINAYGCVFPDRRGCRYKALHVHAADARHVGRQKKDRHLAIEVPMHILLFNFSGLELVYFWQRLFPGFSSVDIITKTFALNVDDLFTDPFFLQHSRTSHELVQLSPYIQSHLRKALAHDMYNTHSNLFGTAFMSDLYKWIGTDTRLPTHIEQTLLLYVQGRPLTYYDMTLMDLYTIARALKVRKDGTRAQLCVMYFGAQHILHISSLLNGLYTVQKNITEREEGVMKRCILLDPKAEKKLVRAGPELHLHLERGPVQEHRHPTPRKKSSTAKKTPSPVRKKPSTRKTPSPVRKKSSTAKKTPSPVRKRSSARKTPSPVRKKSSTAKKTPSPVRKRSSARKTPSPVQKKPSTRKTPLPGRKRSSKHKTPTPSPARKPSKRKTSTRKQKRLSK
jgi:hypothetical protein